ncbi:hypothetical protein BTUL_0052g00400 [Botrytis tulipae]|uniref:Uncharacterized protein n=1 Tax=Botrytis tulipae TaxID=87230 RepID=A0A4Z1EUK0_9HELO|nr:hypothetical protein BTUL_0052g00400 [Botrytis tulipae]
MTDTTIARCDGNILELNVHVIFRYNDLELLSAVDLTGRDLESYDMTLIDDNYQQRTWQMSNEKRSPPGLGTLDLGAYKEYNGLTWASFKSLIGIPIVLVMIVRDRLYREELGRER